MTVKNRAGIHRTHCVNAVVIDFGGAIILRIDVAVMTSSGGRSRFLHALRSMEFADSRWKDDFTRLTEQLQRSWSVVIADRQRLFSARWPASLRRSRYSTVAYIFLFVTVAYLCHERSVLFTRRYFQGSQREHNSLLTPVGTWASGNAPCLLELDLKTTSSQAMRQCIRSLRQKLPLSLTQLDANALWLNGFSDSFLQFLPQRQLPSFETCAVVSNAPSIVKYNVSQEIDSSEAVFRLNRAPVKGFEHIIGSKETIRLINLHSGVPEDESVKPALIAGSPIVFVRQALDDFRRRRNLSRSWDKRQFAKRGMVSEFVHLRNRYPRAQVHLNHPLFAEFSLRYLHVRLMGPTKQTMSTGTQAILLALLLCDKVTSYEVATDDELSRKHRYYYDMRARGYSSAHPQGRETSLMELLSTRRREGTRIYEFDMTE